MSGLSESVLRWAKFQRELGIDDVILDEPFAMPTAAASGARTAPAPTANRPTLPPSRPTAPVAPPLGSARGTARSENPPPAMPRMAPPPPPAPRTAAPAPSTAPAVRAPTRTAIPTFASVAELCAHAATCTRCTLHSRRRSVLATGGPEKSPWAILTLYAWGEDAERGQILAGSYAKPLLDLARELGLPDPAAAAIFACTPDDPSDATIQGFTEAVRCRGHWLQRLKLSGAKAVLVLDHKASTLARGPALPVEWPSFRGQRWELDGIPAISTHHPSRMERVPALRPEVESDLKQILSLIGAV